MIPTPLIQRRRLLQGLGLGLAALSPLARASSPKAPQASKATAAWSAIESAARGQTVYFNAWGGGDTSNAYIAWAADEIARRYGVTLRHVKVSDTADVVRRIQLESAQRQPGTVDLVWINGENFKTLKDGRLLFGPWAQQLPNWPLVDTRLPVMRDFSESTDGLESPWGKAQLTFIADRRQVSTPPRSAAEWLAFARANPGRTSYPRPPDFHGTTFLKQLLLELAPDSAVLAQPVSDAPLAAATTPLWAWLDQIHPLQWRQGREFPASAAEMNRMLGDGELKLSLTFNPTEAAHLILKGDLPATCYSFGWTRGTIGNVHFLAIPANARAPAGAQVVANFLLSPQAQVRKADVRVWGDPSVLKPEVLAQAQKAQGGAASQNLPGLLTETVPVRPEPHASWVSALEREWLKRYGTR
ncbi:ABC transporter substrate-binding protein [Amphibiibacter pelophylacis]|uniref:ABC transporter substrate-binding protein n=1 Tax=Amphibiibacter pelophylacis TaxID=1799477 RepID=A0ACC6NZB0_9BURK